MGVVYVVADGVGPRDTGQIASRTAVESTLEIYRREFNGAPAPALERALREASQSILNLSASDLSLQGMASTCTAAVVHNSRLIVGHVGDSRAYIVRHGHARLLTQDHTWAGEQAAQHGVDRAQLEQHPLKTAPTRLLGAAADVAVDLLEEPLQDGDVIILCTDGLSATLDDSAIARAVQGEDAHGAADELVRAARTAGSSDDISVAVLIIEPVVQSEELSSVVSDGRAPATLPVATEWRSPIVLVGLGGLAIILTGLAAMWLYQLTFSQRIYPGVHALGADLGGRSADEATRALDTQFAEYARQPLTLEVAAQQFFLTPGELGVRFDARATAERALQIGRSGSLQRQLFEQARSLAAGRDTPLVYQVDDARMQAALTPLAQRVESTTGAAQDAALLIDPNGTVRVQASRAGRTLDRSASAAVIRERLRALGAGTLRLPTADVPPSVSEADIAAPRAVAERLLSQPLTVTSGSESIQLDRSQLASILSVRKEQVDGRPRVSLHLLDGETGRLLRPLAERVARPPVHARFNWSPGGLTLAAPGMDGQELDLTRAADTLEGQVLDGYGPASLSPRPVHALGLADAASLNIHELVMDAAVPLDGADPWTRANTEKALAEAHGRLVLPGESFSLLRAVGPLTVERGFQSAPEDSTVIARGANLSASALFQAVFWAGYTIDERQAPKHWTLRAGAPPRGQPGVDAAVDAAQNRDFRFSNTGQQALLIQAAVNGDNASVGLYGTRPGWTVQVSEPVVASGPTPPDEEPDRLDDPNTPAGQELWLEDRSDGFDVSIQRTVISPNEAAPRTLNLTSSYTPSRGRLLVGTKPPD